ncbi:MAG: hypothetical protein M0007_11200 [Actinomycetota bacterium]|nr:hypothetical protein [Actinomycetota bacterium]
MPDGLTAVVGGLAVDEVAVDEVAIDEVAVDEVAVDEVADVDCGGRRLWGALRCSGVRACRRRHERSDPDHVQHRPHDPLPPHARSGTAEPVRRQGKRHPAPGPGQPAGETVTVTDDAPGTGSTVSS